MIPRLPLLLVSLVWLLCASTSTAEAQFETPNRSFHNATAFRLDGRHQTVACESCHLNGQTKGTPSGCIDCHWIRRKDDRYETRLGTQCEQCHRPTSWTDVRWDHAVQSGVVLNPDHRQLACESCHRSASFRAASVTCVGCHQKDLAATTEPNHVAAGFPVTCDVCHRPSDVTWRNRGGGGFNHASVFALVGTHATQSCTSCHANAVYKGTPRDCVGCHQDDYNRSQQPNHAAAGFPTACETCHRATDLSWRGGGSFNHNAVFALVGNHAVQACATCHVNNVYKGTPRDCVGCHEDDYNATKSPPHAAAGFSRACETCHRAASPSWAGAGFNHSAYYALVGKHANQACAACHQNNVYKGTPRDCVGCHRGNYNATRNPPHAASGFSTSCDSCHSASDASWGDGRFSHAFPLSGPHNVSCSRCHLSSNFRDFSCTVCHTRAETDREHRERRGYVYVSSACYSCHPRGKGD